MGIRIFRWSRRSMDASSPCSENKVSMRRIDGSRRWTTTAMGSGTSSSSTTFWRRSTSGCFRGCWSARIDGLESFAGAPPASGTGLMVLSSSPGRCMQQGDSHRRSSNYRFEPTSRPPRRRRHGRVAAEALCWAPRYLRMDICNLNVSQTRNRSWRLRVHLLRIVQLQPELRPRNHRRPMAPMRAGGKTHQSRTGPGQCVAVFR